MQPRVTRVRANRLIERESTSEEGGESRRMGAARAVRRRDGKPVDCDLDEVGAVEEQVDRRLTVSAWGASRLLARARTVRS